MSIRYILYLVIFFPIIALAQIDTAKISIISGKNVESKITDKTYWFSGIDKAGESFAVFYEKSKKYVVHFDSLMNKINSLELLLDEQGKKMKFEELFILKDELYILSSFENLTTQKVEIYIHTLNKKTLLPKNDAKKLGEIQYNKDRTNRLYTNNNQSNLLLKISSDETKIAIINNENYYFEDTFSFLVFDDSFNFLWSNKISVDFLKNNLDAFTITNRENLYFSIITTELNMIEQHDLSSIRYIHAFFDKGKTIKKIPLVIPDKQITALSYSVDNEDNFICAGFCKNNKQNSFWGSCFLKIDAKSKSLTHSIYNEFDTDLYLNECSDEELQKVKKQLNEGKTFLKYWDLLARVRISESGSVFLTGEEFSIGENASYYKEIFAFNYSNDGKLIWSKRIPKHQQTNGYGKYSSYYPFCIGDDFYIALNDNVSNLNIKPCGKPDIFTLRAEFVLTLISFDDYGIPTRKILLSANRKDVWMQPKFFQKFGSNEMLMLGESYDNLSYKIFKVTF